MSKKYLWIFLMFIPVVYGLLGFHFNGTIGIFSLRNIDPEYAYFLSGLGIANGHFHLGYFDHPGTPLQLLLALTYRIVYLFRPGENTFIEDVLMNPDHYLNMTNHVVTIVIASALLISGIQVLRISGNFAAAILIQTVPFFSEITYDIIGRLIPELLLPLPVLLFSVLFLKYLYGILPADKFPMVLYLALTAAFGLSIKLTFIPLALVPLFIIPGWKRKLAYLIITFTAFLLFALPATLEYKTFFTWISNLFIRSREYGSGEANFIQSKQFTENLKVMLTAAGSFFYLAAILVTVTAGFHFFNKKAKNDRNIIWLTTGLIIALLLQLLISTKQYSFRYIIPTMSFLPLMAILSFELFNRTFPWKVNKIIFLLIVVAAFIPGTKKQLISVQIRSKGIGEEMAQKRMTWHYAQTIPDSCIKIIVSQGYGAPFQDYAISYSTAWGGPRMKDYRETLARLYPDTYHYSTWDDQIKTFGKPFVPGEIAVSKRPVVLYLEQDTPELMDKTISKFFNAQDSVQVSNRMIFSNKKTGEALYWLDISPSGSKVSTP
jgi:hypothetical protein